MVGFAMDVGSFQVVVGNLQGMATSNEVIDALGSALSSVLYTAVQGAISHTDHTLNDLAELDHPYARRHRHIRSDLLGHGRSVDGEQGFVHKQRGDLLASLRVEKLPSANSPTGEAYAVWFDVGAAPHAAFVVQGTRWMLPRDVLWATTKDPRVRRNMMLAATRTLGAALRTKANVRFGNS